MITAIGIALAFLLSVVSMASAMVFEERKGTEFKLTALGCSFLSIVLAFFAGVYSS